MNFITYPYDMGLMFSMIMSKVHVGTFTMGKSPNDLTSKCQGKHVYTFLSIHFSNPVNILRKVLYM
jgi:hypothetical protein